MNKEDVEEIKNTNETKKVPKEHLERCQFFHKPRPEWAETWENFCPRGRSVSYFVPVRTEDK